MGVKTLILACVVTVSAICGGVAQSLTPGKLNDPPKLNDTRAPKVKAKLEVIQVLEEGLLVAQGKEPIFLLKNVPKAEAQADGDKFAAYIRKTKEVFKYEDVTGAVRTVSIWVYDSKWAAKW